MSLDNLTPEQKAEVVDLVVLTVKEIREQIAHDIEYTARVWEKYGESKSRKTRKAFRVAADIARGKNEYVDR